LTGSVAEEVLRRAICPVLLVKIPLRPAPEIETEATASPGEVVDVRTRATGLASARTRTLVHTTTSEVIRLIVRTGQEINGQTKGETIVQCLEGRVSLTVLGKTQPLEAGQLLHFPADQPYAFHGIEDASILMTTLIPGPRHA
jgi:quercetin dioxygenase-like cupin family protein